MTLDSNLTAVCAPLEWLPAMESAERDLPELKARSVYGLRAACASVLTWRVLRRRR